MGKRILCLDFDGVIHSYKSGWLGPRTIVDPPVPGAIEFMLRASCNFEINIYSSRSKYLFGRYCMKRYLYKEMSRLATNYETTPDVLRDYINQTSLSYAWKDEVASAVKTFLDTVVKFPKHKPPAFVTIDDRAICFTGEWPKTADLLSFKPWNKK